MRENEAGLFQFEIASAAQGKAKGEGEVASMQPGTSISKEAGASRTGVRPGTEAHDPTHTEAGAGVSMVDAGQQPQPSIRPRAATMPPIRRARPGGPWRPW
jgi:hypothetical protein